MKYEIAKNEQAKAPAYMQLYKQLREDIVGGVYKKNQKLPSKRVLSEELSVSVVTVEHAYAILTDEGYIESRERSGYFVTYDEGETLHVSKKKDTYSPFLYSQMAEIESEIQSLDKIKANPETFPFSVFSKTMRRVITNYQEKLFLKAPYNGCSDFRQAITDYLARSRGIKVSPMQIIIGSGAEYLYAILAQFFRSKKEAVDEKAELVVGLENPSYEKIERVYRANGLRCQMLKMGRDGIETSALRETCADILHVTPYNSFPSGITTSASKRQEYITWANNNNKFIIEDDYDSEFTMSSKVADTVFALAKNAGIENVIYMNTFSRTIAPSMRVGYMIVPEKLVADFEKNLGFYSCTVPVFEQYLLTELLNSGDFERHINRVRRRRRQSNYKA